MGRLIIFFGCMSDSFRSFISPLSFGTTKENEETPECGKSFLQPKKTAHKQFKGNTLIEVITASILFLAVFAASFSLLPTLVPAEGHALELIEADRRLSMVFKELSDGSHRDGEYDTRYSWGTIRATLEPYPDYPDLQRLCIIASFHKNKKRILLNYVVERNP